MSRSDARIPDAEAPGPGAVRGRREAGWPALLTGGAAVLAGALLAVMLLNRPEAPVAESSPSPEASASAATASAEPSGTGSAEPSSTPQPTDAEAGAIRVTWSDTVSVVGEGFVSRLTAEAGRYFVLGALANDATVWSSADGVEWDIATLPFPASWDREAPVFVSADHIVSSGDRLVAIGTVGALDNLNVVVWESLDGASWTELDTGSFMVDAFNVQDATVGPAGIVVITHAFGEGTGSAWRSADGGRTWSESQPDLAPMAASAVVGTASMYLIAGVAYDDEFNPSPRIWTSSDAVAWSPAAVEGSGGSGSVDQLTVNGDGTWVATGSLDGRLVAWRSDDGLDWTVEHEFGAEPELGYRAAWLAGLPNGFLAIDTNVGMTTWTSTDGVAWAGTPMEPPTAPGDGTAELTQGIARIGGRILLAGPITTPDDPGGITWHTWMGTIEE